MPHSSQVVKRITDAFHGKCYQNYYILSRILLYGTIIATRWSEELQARTSCKHELQAHSEKKQPSVSLLSMLTLSVNCL